MPDGYKKIKTTVFNFPVHPRVYIFQVYILEFTFVERRLRVAFLSSVWSDMHGGVIVE